MKTLFVGDVHAVPEELDDCRGLLQLVSDTAKLHAVDRILFLGDVYHHHNIIRAEVLAFWCEEFERLGRSWDTWVLVGNHDRAGEGSPIHALLAHRHVVRVVDAPVEDAGLLYLPYYADREAFVVDACASKMLTLACHQTFDGATYENGFFAKDGVEPDRLPQARIISGHIHTPHHFGKVTYLGAPRWRTLDDANVERAIWVYEFSPGGDVVSAKSFDTSVVCRPIRSAVDSPEKPVALPLDPRVDWRIDVRGPAAWVEERKAQLAGPGVRMRTFASSTFVPQVRESEGVDRAFAAYVDRYEPRFGTDRERLRALARERLVA